MRFTKRFAVPVLTALALVTAVLVDPMAGT